MFSFGKSSKPPKATVNLADVRTLAESLAVPESVARDLLAKYDGNVAVAANEYWTQGGPQAFGVTSPVTSSSSGRRVDGAKISALFDKYMDPDDKLIGPEGTEQLCEDLQVDPSDIAVLALAYALECKRMCEFARPGWVNGWTKLGCDSIESMRTAVPKLRSDLDADKALFANVYNYAFDFAKEEGQRSLSVETAAGMWELLLSGRWKYADAFLKFVNENVKRAVTKDTWKVLLEFSQLPSMADFDPYGAWPSLIDDFVEWFKVNGMQE